LKTTRKDCLEKKGNAMEEEKEREESWSWRRIPHVVPHLYQLRLRLALSLSEGITVEF
jgi:hypothetical protein